MIDGAIDTAGADWTVADEGSWKADDDPGDGVLAILNDADAEAGPLAAGEARERDAQVNDGSLKCSTTVPGGRDKNYDHSGGNSISHLKLPLSGRCAKSKLCN